MRKILASIPIIGIIVLNSYLGGAYSEELFSSFIVGLCWLSYAFVSGYYVSMVSLNWYHKGG